MNNRILLFLCLPFDQGSLFWRIVIPKVRFSENEIGFDIPKVH